MDIATAVNRIRAGGGAHVDMSAARRALLCIVHRSVDAKFSNRFRSGRRQCLADGQVDCRRALNWSGAGAGSIGDASVVYNASRGNLACTLAVKQIAGVDAIEQETIAGIALRSEEHT